ncbi:MAG: YbhB/YbcL family Raf kinase inhibitor-like protein [Chloroflexi bacterium]|nr:MAG: YbhB/YbcL family Raf kinase inhibitor-like protein [Chloroflexota bacterium]
MNRRWPPIEWLKVAGTPVLWIAALSLAACSMTSTVSGATTAPTAAAPPTEVPMTISLTSTAFHAGESIPARYTCSGANVSPPLAWSNVPTRTASFVLLMEDVTGANDFIHWVLFNVPANTRSLPSGVPQGGQLATGARQGTDDAGVVGYYGPCPALPKGATDQYLFTLYALDTTLNLQPGVIKPAVVDAASGHVLATGQLEGTYMLPQPAG